MLQAYGVWVEKSMYGRKYMGVERTTMLIDRDGKIARIWEKVKVPGTLRKFWRPRKRCHDGSGGDAVGQVSCNSSDATI